MTAVAPASVPSLAAHSDCPPPAASAFALCPPAEDGSAGEKAAAARASAAAVAALCTPLAELTCSAAPCRALDDDAATEAEAEAVTGPNRLAAVNAFQRDQAQPARSLAELVHALQEELEGGKKDLQRLYNLMMSYDPAGNEWKRFETWNDEKKYTRNLIAHVPNCFTLMLLCWNPHKASPIHNHSGSECFMRVLKGKILERQYVVRDGEGDLGAKQNWNVVKCSSIPAADLTLTHKNLYDAAAGCTFINDSLGVHAIANPYDESAVTLHCYIPGYDTCSAWCEDAGTASTAAGSSNGAAPCFKLQKCHISYDSEQGVPNAH